MNEEFKNIKEILELVDEELIKNNKETFATLDYEDLVELRELYNKYKKQITDLTTVYIDGVYDGKKKFKDKIKETLGIEEDISEEKMLSYIEMLVDENNRLEDIEDKKVQIEYNNVFNKGVKSVEDKIREKIEYYKKIDNTVGITVLTKLLEKEG